MRSGAKKTDTPYGVPAFLLLELVMGVGPMNLVITNDALYLLSYTSARNDHYNEAARAMQVFLSPARREKTGAIPPRG